MKKPAVIQILGKLMCIVFTLAFSTLHMLLDYDLGIYSAIGIIIGIALGLSIVQTVLIYLIGNKLGIVNIIQVCSSAFTTVLMLNVLAAVLDINWTIVTVAHLLGAVIATLINLLKFRYRVCCYVLAAIALTISIIYFKENPLGVIMTVELLSFSLALEILKQFEDKMSLLYLQTWLSFIGVVGLGLLILAIITEGESLEALELIAEVPSGGEQDERKDNESD